MSETDNKVGTPFPNDGGIAAVMQAAAAIFGNRVAVVRQIAVYGDRSVKTEVRLTPDFGSKEGGEK